MSVADCMYLATFNAFGGDVTPSSWFDHPIHYHPLTQPYIVSQVNLCNNASYNPPGYSVPASLNERYCASLSRSAASAWCWVRS